jgi:hypothetical protein
LLCGYSPITTGGFVKKKKNSACHDLILRFSGVYFLCVPKTTTTTISTGMSRHQQQLSSMPSLTPSHDHHQLDAISSADLSLQQQPMSSVVKMTPRRKQVKND